MMLRTAALAAVLAAFAMPVPQALANNNITLRVLADIERSHARDERRESAEQAFERWIAAVEAGDAAAAAALYAKDAVLMPSSSRDILTTPKARRAYLDKLISGKHPSVKVDESHVRTYDDMAAISGVYSFTYPGRKKHAIPARFSLVLRRCEGGWHIVDHHSSKLP